MYSKDDLLINLNNTPWKSCDSIGKVVFIPTELVFDIDYYNNLEEDSNWDKELNPDSFTVYLNDGTEIIGNLSLETLDDAIDLILGYVNKDENLLTGSLISVYDFNLTIPVNNKVKKWVILDIKNTLNDVYYKIQNSRSKKSKTYWIPSFGVCEVFK